MKPASPAEARPRALWRIAKVSGMLVLVGIFAVAMDWQALGKGLAQADYRLLALATILFLASLLPEVWKYHVLVWPAQDLGKSTRTVFAGLFAGHFLPSNVGGDALKLAAMRGAGRTWAEASTVVLVERGAGLLVLMVAGVLSLAWWLSANGHSVGGHLWALDGLWVWGGLGLGGLVGLGFLARRLCHRPGLASAWHSVIEYWRAWASLSRAVGLLVAIVLFHAARIAAMVVVLQAFGEPAGFAEVTACLAAVALLGLLPITINGLGLTEGTITGVLVAFGFGLGAAGGAAVFNRLMLWLKGLPGALVIGQFMVRSPVSPDGPESLAERTP